MCQVVLGVYRCFDECLPLAMISRTKACLKVLAAKQVELREVRRTRLFGRSISLIDYGVRGMFRMRIAVRRELGRGNEARSWRVAS